MIIKNLKKKIEKKLKLKRLMKNPVMKNKKKTAARLRTSSMKRKRSTAKKGSSYKDSGRKNQHNNGVEVSYKQRLGEKIYEKLRIYFSEIRPKFLDLIHERLVEELGSEMPKYKIEDLVRTLEGLDLSTKGQKTIAEHIISKLKKKEEVMEVLLSLDMSFMVSNKLLDSEKVKQTYLSKRIPQGDRFSSDIKASRSEFDLGNLNFLKLFIRNSGTSPSSIIKGIFTTRMSRHLLASVKIPQSKQSCFLKSSKSVPEWVKIVLDDCPREDVLYGVVELLKGDFLEGSKYMTTDAGLGEVQAFFAKGADFLGGKMETLGYRGEKYEDSTFFVIDLSELALKNKSDGFDLLEYEPLRMHTL